MTTWWSLAPTATTRSSDGMPSGGPGEHAGLAGPGGRLRLRGRQHRHQPVRARRHVGDPALGVEHLDGERPGGDGDRVGQPVLVDERGHRDRALPGESSSPLMRDAREGHRPGAPPRRRRGRAPARPR